MKNRSNLILLKHRSTHHSIQTIQFIAGVNVFIFLNLSGKLYLKLQMNQKSLDYLKWFKQVHETTGKKHSVPLESEQLQGGSTKTIVYKTKIIAFHLEMHIIEEITYF